MEHKEILLLGPSPFNLSINHSGGQLTAMTHLVEYIEKNNISYDIVDTFRSTFPVPSMKDKLKEMYARYFLIKKLLSTTKYKGALVFGTHGLGFWEKLLFSLLIESKGIKTLFFIRSGHFMQSVEKDKYKVAIKTKLMNKLSYIGYQGGKWQSFYENMKIEPTKLVKILNWIPIQPYSKKYEHSKVTFLYVGWMVEKKGINELFEIILEHSDLQNYNFIFIGGGTLLEALKIKAETNNLQNVSFTGWLDSTVIKTYYETSNILLLPSHAEGFPNVILEALSYRLPIIASDVGGIAESVRSGYNGYLIKPKDKKALYEIILKLGSSIELQKEFSKNSEKIIYDNHSISKNCQIIFDLFDINIAEK